MIIRVQKRREPTYISPLRSYILHPYGSPLQLPARSIAALARGVGLLGIAFVVDDGQVLAAHLLRLLVDGALGYAAFTKRSD